MLIVRPAVIWDKVSVTKAEIKRTFYNSDSWACFLPKPPGCERHLDRHHHSPDHVLQQGARKTELFIMRVPRKGIASFPNSLLDLRLKLVMSRTWSKSQVSFSRRDRFSIFNSEVVVRFSCVRVSEICPASIYTRVTDSKTQFVLRHLLTKTSSGRANIVHVCELMQRAWQSLRVSFD